MKEKIYKILNYNKYYILLFVLMCVLSVILNILFNKEINKIDNLLIKFIAENLTNNRLTASFTFLTNFGDIIVFGILILMMFLFFKNKKYSIYMILNLFLAFFLNTILKISFRRTRPLDKLVEATGFSFPSGHTMCSTAFYGLFLYFLIISTDKKTYNIICSIIFLILILLIAFSRIYLNVHYFSDIVGGAIFGVLSLILFIRSLKCLEVL